MAVNECHWNLRLIDSYNTSIIKLCHAKSFLSREGSFALQAPDSSMICSGSEIFESENTQKHSRLSLIREVVRGEFISILS